MPTMQVQDAAWLTKHGLTDCEAPLSMIGLTCFHAVLLLALQVAEAESLSQVLQQSASHLLMAIMEGLLGPYPIGQYSPARGFGQGPSSGPSSAPHVEAWCTSSSADPTNDGLAPQWHTSSPEEVWTALIALKRGDSRFCRQAD